MSREQREALDAMLRDAPLDLGGDVAQQREIFAEMMQQVPVPDDLAAPHVSPLFADLTGLPPLLIQAGSHEILLDDATRLAARAAAADVAVTLDVTPEVPHVFQGFAVMLEEGDAALNRGGAFLSGRLGATVSRD